MQLIKGNEYQERGQEGGKKKTRAPRLQRKNIIAKRD
jgi:hypothetical protein